jgi:hypothetical protein
MHEIDMIEAGGFWQLAIGAKAHQRRTHRFNRRASNDAYIDRDMNHPFRNSQGQRKESARSDPTFCFREKWQQYSIIVFHPDRPADIDPPKTRCNGGPQFARQSKVHLKAGTLPCH